MGRQLSLILPEEVYVPVDPWGWFSDNQIELAFQRPTTIIQRQFVNDPASAQQALLQLQTFKATVQEKRKEKTGGNGDAGLNINVTTKGRRDVRGDGEH